MYEIKYLENIPFKSPEGLDELPRFGILGSECFSLIQESQIKRRPRLLGPERLRMIRGGNSSPCFPECPMDDPSRQLVLNALRIAHEAGLGSVQAQLDLFSEDEKRVILRNMEAFRASLQRQFEGERLAEDVQEHLKALVFGHPNPKVVRLLKQYTEIVQYLLEESRDQLRSSKRKREH